MDYTFFIAFSIGLLSTVHCVGMCSGIFGSLSLSLPRETQSRRSKMLPFILAYNLGRILSYTLAGMLMGAISGGLFQWLSPSYGYIVLQTVATVVLLSIGFHLAGWFPKLLFVERLGRPVWKKLEPFGRRLLPVKSPFHAVLFGAVWGWLPCGLVYSTLVWASSSGDPQSSAMLMFAFGLGTLPTAMTMGMIAVWAARWGRSARFKRISGIILIIMAVTPPVYSLYTDNEHNHNSQLFKMHGEPGHDQHH